MIDVKHLTKFYKKKRVLHDISFQVFQGQILGIMGPNGAGKTSLIKSILKETDFEGSVNFNTSLIQKNQKIDFRNVCIVSDSPHTYDYLTGLEYVHFVLKIKKKPIPEDSKIFEILDFFGIDQYDAQKLIKNYSFGMRRKVAIVASFLSKPKLMVLDEPTIGLDISSVIIMQKLILLASQRGMTFLVTSNNPSLISEICSALLILHKTNAVYWNPNFKNEKTNIYDLYDQKIDDQSDDKVSKILDFWD